MDGDEMSASSVSERCAETPYVNFNSILNQLFLDVVEEQDDDLCPTTRTTEEASVSSCENATSDDRKNNLEGKSGPSYSIISRWRSHLADMRHITELKLDMEGMASYSDDRKSLNIRLVCSLRQLRKLSLRRNGLCNRHLTNHIGCLTYLQELDLEGNRLSSLPYGLRFCRLLSYLSIEGNDFGFMPFVLTHLHNLETIARCRNSFNDNYHFLRTSLLVRLRRQDVPNEKTVPSLFDLAKMKVLSSGVVFAHNRRLPDYLMEVVCSIPYLYLCDQCSGTIVEDEHKFLVFPENFHGLCMPPVQAVTCSIECAQALMSAWDSPFDQTPPAGQNVDISGARHALARHRRRQRIMQTINRCNIL